jgi:hypothetical protein
LLLVVAVAPRGAGIIIIFTTTSTMTLRQELEVELEEVEREEWREQELQDTLMGPATTEDRMRCSRRRPILRRLPPSRTTPSHTWEITCSASGVTTAAAIT